MTDVDPVEIYDTLRLVVEYKNGKRYSYFFGKMYKRRKDGSRSKWIQTLSNRRMKYWCNITHTNWHRTIRIEVIEVKLTPKNTTTYMEVNWDDEGNKIEAS